MEHDKDKRMPPLLPKRGALVALSPNLFALPVSGVASRTAVVELSHRHLSFFKGLN